MLREYHATRQSEEQIKRWFADDYFDLIFWFDRDSIIFGFQFCYDKQKNERALTWIRGKGFRYDVIDGGEALPVKNRSPVLIGNGDFPTAKVFDQFMERSENIDQTLRSFVIDQLKNTKNFNLRSRIKNPLNPKLHGINSVNPVKIL